MNDNLTGWRRLLPWAAIVLLISGGAIVEMIADLINTVAGAW